MSGSTQCVPKHAVDGRRSAIPLFDLDAELFASFGGDPVVPRAAVVLAGTPLGADPAAAQHRLEGGVEGPLIDVEDVARDLAQLEGESPSVHRLFAQQLEREHLEGAAHDFGARLRSGFGRHTLLDNQKEKGLEDRFLPIAPRGGRLRDDALASLFGSYLTRTRGGCRESALVAHVL